MPVMKTPGVYIVEKNAFPNSIVEVATAVPAFIGYTEKAHDRGKPLLSKPTRISSIAEYHQYFGGAPKAKFRIDRAGANDDAAFKQGDDGYRLTKTAGKFNLYYGMLHFFQNGGGPCFIVSVGTYGEAPKKAPAVVPVPGPPAADGEAAAPTPAAPATAAAPAPTVDQKALMDGIETLLVEQEPTMLVIPDAVLLGDKDLCYSLQVQMLRHCGLTMRNRVAILDVYDGDKLLKDKPVDNFRGGLGTSFLDFAAAYYPFVHTTIVGERDVNYENVDNLGELDRLLRLDLNLPAATPGAGAPAPTAGAAPGPAADATAAPGAAPAPPAAAAAAADPKLLQQQQQLKKLSDLTKDWAAEAESVRAKEKLDDEAAKEAWVQTNKLLLNNALAAASPLYKTLMAEIRRQLNLLPPSPAMAGLYTMIDNTRGVWKAPANVSIASVVKPAVNVSHEEQERLNVDTAGKSINAIRSFIGEGVLVWGARTLDGNSLDWRYINVRRTMIMLEESCRLAAKALVFEPNVGSTWVTIKSMIQNFLTGIWKRGGLAGATPEDAFSVHVGLGETMTPEDILEGILRVTVLVAVSRPAEFIEITFQQQMQKS